MNASQGTYVLTSAKVQKTVILCVLSEDVVRELGSAKTNKLSIKFTKGNEFLSDHTHEFTCEKNDQISERVYMKKPTTRKQLMYVGAVTARAKPKGHPTEAAIRKLRAATEREKKQKQKGRIKVVDHSGNTVSATKKTVAGRSKAKDSAQTTFSSASSQDFLLVRSKILHDLAILGERGIQEIVERAAAPKDLCMSILEEIGTRNGGKWKLKNEAFKEVKVHEWPDWQDEHRRRIRVIDNMIKAFDGLGIPLDAPEWRSLLPRKDSSHWSIFQEHLKSKGKLPVEFAKLEDRKSVFDVDVSDDVSQEQKGKRRRTVEVEVESLPISNTKKRTNKTKQQRYEAIIKRLETGENREGMEAAEKSAYDKYWKTINSRDEYDKLVDYFDKIYIEYKDIWDSAIVHEQWYFEIIDKLEKAEGDQQKHSSINKEVEIKFEPIADRIRRGYELSIEIDAIKKELNRVESFLLAEEV
ncbi:2414_t:CDS:2 [Paraglomus occultum]|uniref:2414_t:CDS:1 n=1 Tax=Paraglomus occultum TaxID=144539 RepID=A0A9N9A134_9GLOM|nr:2414_t:CDS:2 [Paraglomus occultum]